MRNKNCNFALRLKRNAMDKLTYDEALCTILSKICTPIAKRKDQELYDCGIIVKNKLIENGTWQKVMDFNSKH